MSDRLFLPFLRRWKIWTAVLAALLIFLISGALLSRAVTRTQEQIDRTYEEMEIDFRLGPGRTRYGSSFFVTFYQLSELVKADWYEDMHATYAIGDSTVVPEGVPYVRLLWAADPEAEYGPPSSGAYGSGIYMAPSLAEALGVEVGEYFPIGQWSEWADAGTHGFWEDYTVVTALSDEIPEDTIILSWDTFKRYFDSNMIRYKANVVFSSFTFRIRPERNREIRDIVTEIQRTVNNTPHPADRNKFVAVYYNETEINGIMEPLEQKQASAVFFEKLFRTLLPFVVYILEVVAVLSLANEYGVRRLLGEGGGRVFLSLWGPAALLLLAGYLLAALILWLTGLLPYAHPGSYLYHMAGSFALTALPSALLCAIDPLTLLKEHNDE